MEAKSTHIKPPAGTGPVPSSLAIDGQKLVAFLYKYIPQFQRAYDSATTEEDKFIISKFTHGQSNPTYLIQSGSGTAARRFVVRRRPPGKLLPSAHQVDREFNILCRLKTAGVTNVTTTPFKSEGGDGHPVSGHAPFAGSASVPVPTPYLLCMPDHLVVYRGEASQSSSPNTATTPSLTPLEAYVQGAHHVIVKDRIQVISASSESVADFVDQSGAGTSFYVMAYVDGYIEKDPSIPSTKARRVTPVDRFAMYTNLAQTLANLHSLDIKKTGLDSINGIPNPTVVSTSNKPSNKPTSSTTKVITQSPPAQTQPDRKASYAYRTLMRWAKQFRSAISAAKKHSDHERTIADKTEKDVEALISALESGLPSDPSIFMECFVHGDYRIDNIIYHRTGNRVLAVLDWELASIGHPVADLAYASLPYIFPVGKGLPGLYGLNLRRLGIPSLADFVSSYVRMARHPGPIQHFDYYVALSLLRVASILQGVYTRSLLGNASSSIASQFGPVVPQLANMAINVLSGKIPLLQPPIPSPTSSLSLSSSSSTSSSDAFDITSIDSLNHYGFPFSKQFPELYARVKRFIMDEVATREELFEQQHRDLTYKHGHPWVVPQVMEDLKSLAKQKNIWNFFLPQNKNFPHNFGAKISNLDYAPLCELMGRYPHLAPEACNCSAPDTGNMEVLALHGTPSQQEQWLIPLLNGDIRSAYAMTEPDVASSDATNISLYMEDDGDSWLLNGTKWWTSGAMDPRCKVLIVMARSAGGAGEHATIISDKNNNSSNNDTKKATSSSLPPPHARHSMLIVPMDTPGIQIERYLSVYGYDDAPHGHAQMSFRNVRVPKVNVILGVGRGFEIAQNRLGPGRIHHCMRLIGMGERALEIMLRRVQNRSTFGTPTAKKGVILSDIAKMRCDIQQARLLVLQTAALMDRVGNKAARQQIAMIKAVVPAAIEKVIDRAIQSFGGMGVCQDTVLPRLWSGARCLRLADGPDEVHNETIAKIELTRAKL